ncbi:hypothetical protein [Pseudomonas putida]|uniref:hypothetical protein n=1 Tax=Pseudomonas putida TaxID=303 RepID=UPI001EE8E20C|nr:hypothetical protein [Pseudomonas putida]
MIVTRCASNTYRALLEQNPGKALRLDKEDGGEAVAIIDGDLCCLPLNPDNTVDPNKVTDLMQEAWCDGGWHGAHAETQDAIDNPIFIDISTVIWGGSDS